MDPVKTIALCLRNNHLKPYCPQDLSMEASLDRLMSFCWVGPCSLYAYCSFQTSCGLTCLILNNALFLVVCMCAHLCGYLCTWLQRPQRTEKGIGFLELELQSHELPDLGAGSWTLVLCKSNTHYKLRSHLSSSYFHSTAWSSWDFSKSLRSSSFLFYFIFPLAFCKQRLRPGLLI